MITGIDIDFPYPNNKQNIHLRAMQLSNNVVLPFRYNFLMKYSFIFTKKKSK